jgi:signal transduction histidine kinase
MDRLHILNHSFPVTSYSPEREALQESIRESGKSLTLFAEEIAAREKEFIQKLLRTSRTVLLSSTGAMVFLFFILITLIREKIVSSLKLLKEYTRKVAHGEMVDPPESKVEEEINSLFQAFARMNNELRFRQRQMVQSEKLASLGTLLAGVAHELNNPLSNISTSAQILREEIDNPEKEFLRTMVNQIDEQTDKARDIVRTLLEFSRTRDFSRQDILLREVVEETIKLLRSDIPSAMQIELDIPDNLLVSVDKQRMQQVFLNLIKNGVDACGGQGRIWITARECIGEERREVEILVSDNGAGIPPEDLKKIFDPFYTSKDVGKGSGLGLFIVHDIIESHGGEITVDSRLNEGTTFIIWIPGGPLNQ